MRGTLIILCAAASPALAQAPPAAPPFPANPAQYLIQALLSLGIVVALIWGAYWLLRRAGGQTSRAAHRGPAELLQSIPLQGGYALHVARIGGRLVAFTCGPGGSAPVADVDEAAATNIPEPEGEP